MSVDLSKKMARVLRHELNLMSGGYYYVDDLLRRPGFSQYTEHDVRDVVRSCNKQRFKLQDEGGRLKVKATQGHSKEFSDHEMQEIRNPNKYRSVIHGTTYEAWEIIKSQGLHKRRRTHIHFAPGEKSDSHVISGMPGSSKIKIYIDMEQALRDGIKFYQSENNVILSEGDHAGYIKPKYFKKVIDIRTGNHPDVCSGMANLRL